MELNALVQREGPGLGIWCRAPAIREARLDDAIGIDFGQGGGDGEGQQPMGSIGKQSRIEGIGCGTVAGAEHHAAAALRGLGQRMSGHQAQSYRRGQSDSRSSTEKRASVHAVPEVLMHEPVDIGIVVFGHEQVSLM